MPILPGVLLGLVQDDVGDVGIALPQPPRRVVVAEEATDRDLSLGLVRTLANPLSTTRVVDKKDGVCSRASLFGVFL